MIKSPLSGRLCLQLKYFGKDHRLWICLVRQEKKMIISLNPLYDVIIDVFKSVLQEDYVHS